MIDSRDQRFILGQAIQWSVRISTISLEMVIPGVIGLWIDRRLGTVLVFLILGAILGMTTGMMHLIRMVTSEVHAGPRGGKSSEDDVK